MPSKLDEAALNDIHRALRQLGSSIYDSRSLKYAYLELDTIASGLCRIFPDILPEQTGEPPSPSEILKKLVSKGLHINAIAAAAKLEELSSQKWYGNPNEEEQLNEADTYRDELYQAVQEFIEMKEAAEEDEEESESAEGKLDKDAATSLGRDLV